MLSAAAPAHVASVREHLIDLLTPAEVRVLTSVSEKVIKQLTKSE